MSDSDLLFDSELDLALMDGQVNLNPTTSHKEDNTHDDFDDDLNLDELVDVVTNVEQQHAATNNSSSRQISFFSESEDDPEPPPPLSTETTACFHPFDPEQLRTWIYPINYPIRAYQLNIVRKALFQNILVALPTGLGKTFIAAVVMFNYWRWFPNSKIIFMAPTRPLVMQQIEACFTICGLPQEDTVDITGNTSPAKRRGLWQTKRVFFATPQTVQKDLESSSCPAAKICCIVVDEAHRATGNYAYSEVVRKIAKKNTDFRVLALSATPGSTLDAVQAVINNLHIANIQIRTEDSMDIREFSYGKQIQNVIVRLNYTEGSTGSLPRIIQDFRTKVFLPLLTELSKKPTNVVADVERASPFRLRSARLHFNATANNFRREFKFSVTALFLVAEAASRAHDLLCQHGVVPFVESIESTFKEYKETMDAGKRLNKSQVAFYYNSALNGMLNNLKREIDHNPGFVGHPKLDRLVAILLDHFSTVSDDDNGHQSKVMIFSSFRSSVHDICRILDRHRPLIRSTHFVGQSSDKQGTKGLRQSEQQDVIQKFKRDEFNVLVSTSIGEEGLDIGELDLIVCFDSQTSPIRMLQRMGRTGRKRKGKCIMLMTESEEAKFAQAKQTYTKIQQLVSRGENLRYYRPNPTVIPANYKPTLCRKKLTVGVYQPKQTNSRKRKLQEITDFKPDGCLKPEVEQAFLRQLGATSLSQAMDRHWPIKKTIKSLDKHVPIQSRIQKTFRIGHSRRTVRFTQSINKMEHRILHPEEQADLSVGQQLSLEDMSSRMTASQQPKLILPSKKNKKQKTQHVDEPDGDLAEFVEQNAGMLQYLLNNDEQRYSGESSRSVQQTHEQPHGERLHYEQLQSITKRKLDKEAEPSTVPKKKQDKGKGKEILSPPPPANLLRQDDSDSFNLDTFDLPSAFSSWDPAFLENAYNELNTESPNINQEAAANMATLPPSQASSSNMAEQTDSVVAALSPEQVLNGALLSPSPPMAPVDVLLSPSDPQQPMEPIDALSSLSPPMARIDASLSLSPPLAPINIVLSSSPPLVPANILSSQPLPMTAPMNTLTLRNINGEDDEFDTFFPIDETLLLQTETMINAFRDAIRPVFPFERKLELSIRTIFEYMFEAMENPDFTEIGFILFDTRNKRFKAITGHDMAVKLLYPPQSKPRSLIQKAVSPPGSPLRKDITANITSDDEGDDEFEIDDEVFAHFIENRFSEDEGVHAELEGLFEQVASTTTITDNNKSVDMRAAEPTLPEPEQQAEQSEQTEPHPDEQQQPLPQLEQLEQLAATAVEPAQEVEQVFLFNFDDSSFSEDEEGAPNAEQQDESSRTATAEAAPAGQVEEVQAEATTTTITSTSPARTEDTSVSAQQEDNPPSLVDNTEESVATSHEYMTSPVREGPTEAGSLLSQLSRGLYTPSPLREPLSYQSSQNDDSSPLVVRRRQKRSLRFLNDDSDSDNNNSVEFRSKQRHINNDDLLASSSPVTTTTTSRRRRRMGENPFIDDEADRSSDGGHTTTTAEDWEGQSSMLSFIDDDEDDEEQQASAGNYARSLLLDSSQQPPGRRHWMNKFDANKWLQMNEEDSLVDGSEESEEELESIQDFSSEINTESHRQDLYISNDEDDDFM
ncbi:MAG: hypothetical protein EXX96DRAFT_545491 [Benjaminiella poitrasii]|nr:MAG: hypothetical protein EXX96DRAFT_545491 [Benjaminiella poitrasii]